MGTGRLSSLGSQTGFPFTTVPWGGSGEKGNTVVKLRAQGLLPW